LSGVSMTSAPSFFVRFILELRSVTTWPKIILRELGMVMVLILATWETGHQNVSSCIVLCIDCKLKTRTKHNGFLCNWFFFYLGTCWSVSLRIKKLMFWSQFVHTYILIIFAI
jgi:hypothetical protein